MDGDSYYLEAAGAYLRDPYSHHFGIVMKGKIGASFKELMERANRPELTRLFAQADEDGSGAIEVSEFVEFINSD